MARALVKAAWATLPLVFATGANIEVATAQTDVRIVGVSEAQWVSDSQEASISGFFCVPVSTATANSGEQRPLALEQKEQVPDLYENLFLAATSGEAAARQSDQPTASLPPSDNITPLPAEPVRVAEHNPEPGPRRNTPASAGNPPRTSAPTPTEAIVVPDNRPASTNVPSEAVADIHMGSCESGNFLFGCPYYPTQSGTHTICGVDCGRRGAPCCATWADSHPIPWSLFGPGEYVGPPRIEHLSTYYLRVNDLVTLTFIVSRKKNAEHYKIGVGDRLRIESKSDETLDREVQVQPDGIINLPLIGDVNAAGRTVKDLRDDLIERFGRIEQQPLITVTPLDVNNAIQEIIKAVTSQSRSSGQALDLRVTPEGTIQAPGLGSVYVQGLTLEEVRSELESRYAATFGPGLLVSPSLTDRAKSYVFLGGEVKSPGRYTLEGPTTVMQAITLAGGFNVGGNVREVVVFRRDENWCLKATKINVRGPLYGKDPCPVNDVWLRDNDLVVVPKQRILCADDVIQLYFTRGVYAVFPITFVKDFSQGSSVVPVP